MNPSLDAAAILLLLLFYFPRIMKSLEDLMCAFCQDFRLLSSYRRFLLRDFSPLVLIFDPAFMMGLFQLANGHHFSLL